MKIRAFPIACAWQAVNVLPTERKINEMEKRLSEGDG